MAYIAGLVTTGLFFLVLHYFTEVTKSQKIIISFIVLSIIMAAIAFNSYSASQRENMTNIVMKFKQDKTVKCGEFDVNNSDYTLSIGTYTFIGKKDKPNYGQMISVSNCE